jgi:hypothetical protein
MSPERSYRCKEFGVRANLAESASNMAAAKQDSQRTRPERATKWRKHSVARRSPSFRRPSCAIHLPQRFGLLPSQSEFVGGKARFTSFETASSILQSPSQQEVLILWQEDTLQAVFALFPQMVEFWFIEARANHGHAMPVFLQQPPKIAETTHEPIPPLLQFHRTILSSVVRSVRALELNRVLHDLIEANRLGTVEEHLWTARMAFLHDFWYSWAS